MKIKVLPYNPLEVNCYVCYDDTKACAIIDPSCSTNSEFESLFTFIKQNDLSPKHVIITHAHIDHIIGADSVCKNYNLPLTMHKQGLPLLAMAFQHSDYLGLRLEAIPEEKTFVEDGDILKFGNSELKVLYTPGHADGSVCLVDYADKTVFTGDVLFHGSIGRTDLMTGNFDTLKHSIYNKLFVLNDEVTVRPGHGGRTQISFERYNNPFL